MSDRKYIDDRRKRDDDVPIIGDFSGASDFGARPVSPPPAAQPASPPPAASRSASKTNESWRLDPKDVARYARRAKGKGREERRASGAALRVAAVLLIAAAVGVIVYRNYEPLRTRAVGWLAITRSEAPAITGEQAGNRKRSRSSRQS
jgi:hypothetical protein